MEERLIKKGLSRMTAEVILDFAICQIHFPEWFGAPALSLPHLRRHIQSINQREFSQGGLAGKVHSLQLED